jgi:hypothetical protein
MTDDHDVSLAATAFATAMPTLEFRPGAPNAPRRNRRRATAITASMATVATVAVTTTALLSSGTNAPTAWSATPKHLSRSASELIDQECRGANPATDGMGASSGTPKGGHVGHGFVTGSAGGPIRDGSGRIVGKEGVSESGSAVQRASGTGVVHNTSGGPKIVGPAALPHATRIGNLPLILVDARGAMTLALYGDANHHVICTVDPNGHVMLTPDTGAWPSGNLVNAAASFGSAIQSADGTSSSSMKLLGTTAPNVTAISVEVPNVGTVEATVRNGHYALFVPQDLLGTATTDGKTSFRSTSWKAHVTTSDGVVHDTTIEGSAPDPNAP